MENRILVVDDEDFHRELMRKLLLKLGYDVAVVDSAEAAFSYLAKEKVAIIITDLILLEMDGVEFCQKIRETDNKTIVIALSGHTDLYDADKLKEVGFDNHLTKPSRPSRKRFKRALRSSNGERKSRIKHLNSRHVHISPH
jgi:CheY-like chemotaxis protein